VVWERPRRDLAGAAGRLAEAVVKPSVKVVLVSVFTNVRLIMNIFEDTYERLVAGVRQIFSFF